LLIEELSQDGFVLKDASAKLRNDKDVVIAAVKQDGDVLQYVSAKFKNDKDLVLADHTSRQIAMAMLEQGYQES